MNLTAEKEEIIKRICEEDNLTVIHAIKELLDNSSLYDEALEKELDISIREADNGEESSVEEVLAEFRKKYAA